MQISSTTLIIPAHYLIIHFLLWRKNNKLIPQTPGGLRLQTDEQICI